MRFMGLKMAICDQYSIQSTISLNLLYYYFVKYRSRGKSLRFCSFPRTIMLFGLTMYTVAKYKAEPKVEKEYHVNINDLFDSDEPFLWENPHFKALVRRIQNSKPHLINPSFEID